MTILEELKQKIEEKKHKVGIIGLGYVGLPLLNAICKKNVFVCGFDVDQKKIDSIYAGKSYIGGVSDEDLSTHLESELCEATTDFTQLSNVDVVVICVPTPLDDKEQPDLSYVENTTIQIAENLAEGQLIILESTTYPGTVSDVMRPILDKSAKVKSVEYFLAYSPEREDPGNQNFETSSTPKIVGAESDDVLKVAVQFYEQFIQKIVSVSSIEVAEAAKITENIFRSVNIAMVNELKLIYDRMGIDIWEVIDAAATKPFGYMPFYPGPGIGGHCIPIDPIYLSWKAEQVGQKTKFIELAASINQSMTDYICEKLREALGVNNLEDLKGKKICVLGVAYKKNVSDQRESPAFPLMKKLNDLGAQVSFHDPYIPNILPSRHYAEFNHAPSSDLSDEFVQSQDALIVVTDHDAVDYDALLNSANCIIDTRNVYKERIDKVIKA